MSTCRIPRPGPAERRRLESLLGLPAEQAAPALLGQVLVWRRAGRLRRARIVETEAYLAERDPAAHAFHGRTARTWPLWGPPGTIYVYLVYGQHHCLNLAADREGVAGCVLIRACEPLRGSGLPAAALSGPGRLCRTLGLSRAHSGASLFAAGAILTLRQGPPVLRVGVTRRVGLRRAAERRLRFYDQESPVVSAGPR